jgi:KDO2-lipid IV(A) lauroyltransferase
VWQYRGFRILQSIMERLPRRWAYALSVVVARLALIFARNARRRLETNLRVVLPQAPDAELRAVTWLNFRNHSKAYADLMQLPSMRVADMRHLLKVDGEENLAAALAMGKGVIVCSPHMGSWELAAAMWSVTVAPVNLFAEVLEPRELYDWYRITRGRLGISVLPLNGSGLRHVLQALKANEMVVTAVDRDITGTGIEMDFFGRPTRVPSGPAAIALRYGVPLLPVCVYRLPDDTYQAVGNPPVIARSTGDREGDERTVMKIVLAQLEDFIRAHPEQWHVPHEIWSPAALSGGPATR